MSSYLYIISAVAGGKPCAPVKVGITNSPNSRLATIKTSSPLPLTMFFVLPVPNREAAALLEHGFHSVMVEHRLHGEWFDMEPIEAKAALAANVRAFHEHHAMVSPETSARYMKTVGLVE